MTLLYEEILDDFPNMKLSYENIIHKKVYNLDYVTAIPEGKKCFAWFTNYNGNNVCFILELAFNNNNNNFKIIDIKIMNCCFSTELSYGTIFYGTKFYKGNVFFTIENIFYYKGKNVASLPWGKKLNIINEIMTYNIKQQSYNNSFIVFGLPLIRKNIEELLKDIENIKYKIEKIQFVLFNKVNVLLFVPYKKLNYVLNNEPSITSLNVQNNSNYNTDIIKISNIPPPPPPIKQLIPPPPPPPLLIPSPNIYIQPKSAFVKTEYKHITKREIIFKIKPDIQNDIYNLYCDENNTETLYDIAYIPDYNTSVFMNKLFRKIKENENLDALEESDDEDEFEDEREDKFVYLDKSYNMYCVYNNKFKKWVPIKIANENTKIINKKELNIIGKK
jgi:hypothetical protein